MHAIFRSSPFWIIFFALSVVCAVLSFYFFPIAFSLVKLDITMNRVQALEQARSLAKEYKIGPSDTYDAATSFDADRTVQTYAELEAGGKDVFIAMMHDGLYAPYTWNVRHFKEFEPHEALFVFTPEGKRYGFAEKLSEKTPGAELTTEQAQEIAEREASTHWHIDFDKYTRIEASKETRASKRIDHTFVYELKDVKLHEALYRLQLTVSGDKLTGVEHSVKIPESFIIKYKEMRASNTSIASAASIAMFILYIIGCALLGTILLLRNRWIKWKKPALWGFFVALLSILIQINKFPLLWMYYDTSSSTTIFALNYLTNLLHSLVVYTFFYTIIFAAAEALTRKAFGHQIQFWKLWSSDGARSIPVLGQTVGGYLLSSIDLLYVIAAYGLATKFLGWWSPADVLADPDVLATYMPWFNPVARAFMAGFTEECIFRALPLATAAILGKRFGHKKWWIAGAFVLQIVVFGAAHANYAAQPAYARVLELIVPSTVFGALYLIFGLLPAILSHFIFDAILMALPLFTSYAAGAWFDRLMVILLCSIPLLVVLIARLRKGSWISHPYHLYNRSWQPLPADHASAIAETFDHASTPSLLSKKMAQTIIVAGAIGLALWIIATPMTQEAPPIAISKEQAINIARDTLEKNGVTLSPDWSLLTRVDGSFRDSSFEQMQHIFIWQRGGKELYHTLLNNYYLYPPIWIVQFVRFEGSASERAEKYRVFIAREGEVIRVTHTLAEDHQGKELGENEARELVRKYIEKDIGINLDSLQEIKAVAEKHPNRKDWNFTFADKAIYPLETGEARIEIELAGDTVVDTSRYIKVPESWERSYNTAQQSIGIIQNLCATFFYLLLLCGIAAAIIQLGNMELSFKWSLILSAVIFGLYVLNTINTASYLISFFNTSEPFWLQLFKRFGSPVPQWILQSGILGVLVILVSHVHGSQRGNTLSDILIGISSGFIAAGAIASALYMLPKNSPVWASFSPLRGYLPSLSAIALIVSYLFMTALLFLLIRFANYLLLDKKWSAAIIAPLFIIAVLLISGEGSIASIPEWFTFGIMGGIVLYILYYYVLRTNYSLLPLAVGTVVILGIVQEGIFNAYHAAPLVACVSALVIGVVSYCWFLLINKKNVSIMKP